MATIILIETSTALCSAAVERDGKTLAIAQSDAPRMHASMTAPYVQEVLKRCGLRVQDCDAVCVSMGPGSYTGLRVGSSTAKGLCFGAGIPLLALGTLDILAAQASIDGLVPQGCKYIIPMIDARRMEVYTATFSADGSRLTQTRALVVTPDSFSGELAQGPSLFIGDGAGKCRSVIGGREESDTAGSAKAGASGKADAGNPGGSSAKAGASGEADAGNPGDSSAKAGADGASGNAGGALATFVQCCPRADAMAALAEEEYRQRRFRDTAYFEPFYLKEFTATVSARKLF